MPSHAHDEASVRARRLIEDWLTGKRPCDTHGALCAELRAALGVDLLDQDIEGIFCHADDHDLDTDAVLARLLGSDDLAARGPAAPPRPR